MATKFIDYRKASREAGWGKEKEGGTTLNMEELNCGTLLRIADATELMAQNYKQMQSDLEMYQRWYNEERDKNIYLSRTNSALKSWITRLKNKLNHTS